SPGAPTQPAPSTATSAPARTRRDDPTATPIGDYPESRQGAPSRTSGLPLKPLPDLVARIAQASHIIATEDAERPMVVGREDGVDGQPTGLLERLRAQRESMQAGAGPSAAI